VRRKIKLKQNPMQYKAARKVKILKIRRRRKDIMRHFCVSAKTEKQYLADS
jgi:hypothetical protein